MLESIIPQTSSFAKDVDSVILLVTALVGFWFFIVQGVFFYFLYTYRKQNSPKADYITGEEHKYNKWIHWAHYAVILCDIVIVIAAVQVWYKIKQELPPADETIRITAVQWGWRFRLPGPDGILDTADDIRTVDELHIQKDRTYHFKLRSDDVVHSFSVPTFRLKQDAIPGREITGWFKPIKTGLYDIQCAEICGIGHGLMGAKLYIKSEQEHNEWLQANLPAGYEAETQEDTDEETSTDNNGED